MSSRIETYDSKKDASTKFSKNESCKVKEVGVPIDKDLEFGEAAYRGVGHLIKHGKADLPTSGTVYDFAVKFLKDAVKNASDFSEFKSNVEKL